MNKAMTTQTAIKRSKAETAKKRKFFKLLEFVAEHNLYGSDEGSLDEHNETEAVTPPAQQPMIIAQVETINKTHPKSIKDLEFKNPDEAAEVSIVIEDDNEDVANRISRKQDPQHSESTPSFHYGMAIAKDVFELSEDLKIDAKIEIMQIIGKYQKRQLQGTEWDPPAD